MRRRGKLNASALLLSLLLLGIISGGGGSERSAHASSAQKKLQGRQLEQARVLYANNCARCHGMDGRGQTAMGRAFAAPNLTDAEWWKKTRPTDKRLTASMRHGRGQMPAFGQQLSKSEIAALVRFVRAFDGK